MNQAEDLTRRAARAIELDVTSYVWDDGLRGLCKGDVPIFAPLTDYGDAFMIETVLSINVHYQTNATTISIHASCEKHAVVHMVSVPKDSQQDALANARMRLAVTYAALIDIAERENG